MQIYEIFLLNFKKFTLIINDNNYFSEDIIIKN